MGRVILPPSVGFALITQIPWHFVACLIEDIPAKRGIPNLPQAPEIRKNPDRDISVILAPWPIRYRRKLL